MGTQFDPVWLPFTYRYFVSQEDALTPWIKARQNVTSGWDFKDGDVNQIYFGWGRYRFLKARSGTNALCPPQKLAERL